MREETTTGEDKVIEDWNQELRRRGELIEYELLIAKNQKARERLKKKLNHVLEQEII